jgi:hypothetical protein
VRIKKCAILPHLIFAERAQAILVSQQLFYWMALIEAHPYGEAVRDSLVLFNLLAV